MTDEEMKEVCQKILETPLYLLDKLDGTYECTCPICNSVTSLPITEVAPVISDVSHQTDCGYIIAKTILADEEEE